MKRKKRCPTCGDERLPGNSYCRPCTNERARAYYHKRKVDRVPVSVDAQVKRFGYPLEHEQQLDDVLDGVLTASELAHDLGEHPERVMRWTKRRAKATRKALPYHVQVRAGSKGYPRSVLRQLDRLARHEIQLRDLADELDVSHSTLRRWWAAYRDERGLPPLPRGKHAPPSKRDVETKKRDSYGPFSATFKRIAAERLREAQAVGDDVEDIAREYGIPARYLYRWAEELRA